MTAFFIISRNEKNIKNSKTTPKKSPYNYKVDDIPPAVPADKPVFVKVASVLKENFSAFTYYTNAEKRYTIERFCRDKRTELIGENELKILIIYFFNDPENTPEIDINLKIPAWSEPYLVANYQYDPATGEDRLRYLK